MEVDIEAKSTMDLLDCDVWQKLLDDIRSGKYFGIFASPPCCTFSVARKGKFDRGPCQLRGADMPQLYKALLDSHNKSENKSRLVMFLQTELRKQSTGLLSEAIRGQSSSRHAGKEIPHVSTSQSLKLLRRTPDACFKRFAQCNLDASFKRARKSWGILD